MPFLPMVERELRARARRPRTHLIRLAAATLAILSIAAFLLMSAWFAGPVRLGGALFAFIAFAAFIYALGAGIVSTSDAISREKRDGTLGFLFLTPLRGYDVVAGKLTAAGLDGWFKLLAILPPLAMCFVLGGVTGGEFWRLVMTLMNTLFLSLSAGLCVSSRQIQARRSWWLTVALVSAITLVPCLIPDAILGVWAGAFQGSPLLAFLRVSDAAYRAQPSGFWFALGGSHALAWLLLASACHGVARRWQTDPGSEPAVPPRRTLDPVRAPSTAPFALRREQLDANPALWLASRALGPGNYIGMVLLIGSAIGAVALWATGASFQSIQFVGAGFMLLKLGVAAWIAVDACHLFPSVREAGGLEMLLTTPLTASRIVQGHAAALRHRFGPPLAMLAAVEVILLIAALTSMGLSGIEGAICLLYGLFYLLYSAEGYANIVMAGWYGLWRGLNSRGPGRALLDTLVPAVLIPLAGGFCCYVLWPVLGLGKDLALIFYGRDQLQWRFLERASAQPASGD